MYKKLIMLLMIPLGLSARFHMVAGSKMFDRIVNKYPYMVVCFAASKDQPGQSLSKEEKRRLKEDFRHLKENIRAASYSSNYKEYLSEDVGFVLVDVASGRADEVDEAYAVEHFPSCLLFKNGQPILDRNKQAQLLSPISKASVLGFMDQHFGDDLDALRDERKEEHDLKRQERIAYAAYYHPPYNYWGWGYPYSSWGYPYYGWGYRVW